MKPLVLLFAFATITGLVTLPQATHAASSQICYDLYQPVCAAQQIECFAAPCYPIYKTYSNSCFMQADGATLIHQGECTATETGSVGHPATTTPPEPTRPYVPPTGCIAWFDGCNSCAIAGPNKGTICTMMACQANQPRAGYCRTYAATSTPPVITPTHRPSTPVVTVSTSSPVASASTTATSTGSHSIFSFFSRLWHTIIGWFGFH